MPALDAIRVHSNVKTSLSPKFERVNVLGVSVGVLTHHRLTALLRECLDSGLKGWLSYVNVHALNLAATHPWFQLFLNKSLVTYCDGQGVRFGAFLQGNSIPERIVMSDWIYDVCETAVLRQLRVFFLGSTETVVNQASSSFKILYPELLIAGVHHGYLSDIDSEAVVHLINKATPDILVVGMGMPLQEEWILKYIDRLDVRIVCNAGSCFDYVAGVKKRCPTWMGVMGFEWLYRLVQEPRRLWQRYLIGNPLFVWRIIRNTFQLKFFVHLF